MNWNAADESFRTAADADDAIESTSDASVVIFEVAALDPISYGQRQKTAADALGITLSILNKAVEDQQRVQRPQKVTAATVVEIVDPWDMPVDGLTIAEDIRAELLRFIIFPSDSDADAATLWILGTYLMNAWRLWPKMLVQSAEKRCSKSTFLEVIEAHVRRPQMTSNISVAALFRCIEACAPTLLIDDADRFLR